MEKELLIGLEILALQVARIEEVTLLRPLRKLSQGPAMGVDGGAGIRALAESGEKSVDEVTEPEDRSGDGAGATALAATAHGVEVGDSSGFRHELGQIKNC